jgi:hypothetical protein
MGKLKVFSLVLISMSAILALPAGCSSANKRGTTIQFTRAPATSSVASSTSAPAHTIPIGGGKIGGLSTGGKPTVMTHPVYGFENCISCHGVTGSALHLVYDSVHPCEQCHNMKPELDWGIHDNSSAGDLPRLNASCAICHKPS